MLLAVLLVFASCSDAASELSDIANAAGELKDSGVGFGDTVGAATNKSGTASATTVAGTRDSAAVVLSTSADGSNERVGNASIIDTSNLSQGYFMVKYTGGKSKIKMQITKAGGTTYTYDLNPKGVFEAFVISQGDGSYTITINENIQGNSYSVVDTATINVKLDNEFLPFLHPNQYVDYDSNTISVPKSVELARSANTDLDVIDSVFDYVVGAIDYDFDTAATISDFYIPDIDSTLTTGKGMCFDYAVTMTSMLRVQRIPTQLVLGYAGSAYHAWINVYTPETGWIDGAIHFDGSKWVRMDPTFVSTGGSGSAVTQYVGDGSNYNAMYFY